MTITCKSSAISVGLLAAVWAPADLLAQSDIKERIAAGVEAVKEACAADMDKFCSKVSRGQGRMLVCMQAHDDQLSWRCQFALYRASRKLDHALDRVERVADACWNDIETQCRNVEIGQCVMDKAGSLSPACQKVVAGIRKTLRGLASLKGMPAFSADGKRLGQVVDVVRGPDGKVQEIHIEVGRFLGIGDRTVTIDADEMEELADRIKLRINGDAVRSLPEAKNPSQQPR